MTELTPYQVELLQKWLCDPEQLTAAELAELQSSPVCRARMAEFGDVVEVLDAAGQEERDTELARATVSTELQAWFDRDLDARLGAEKQPGRVFWALASATVAAAAAAVIAWFALGGGDIEPAELERPRILDQEDGWCAWSDLAEESVTWSAPAPPDGSIVIRVVLPGGDEELDVVELFDGETQWRPAAGADYPERVELIVERRDIDGRRVGQSARVRLRRVTRSVDAEVDLGASESEFPDQVAAIEAELRDGGDFDYAVQLAVQRVGEFVRMGRVAEARHALAAWSKRDLSGASLGAANVHLYEAQFALSDWDVEAARSGLSRTRALLGAIEAGYGVDARREVEVSMHGVAIDIELLRGRADLALRAARKARDAVDAMVDPETKALFDAGSQLGIARAALAAGRPAQLRTAAAAARETGTPAEQAEAALLLAMTEVVSPTLTDVEPVLALLEEARRSGDARLRVTADLRHVLLLYRTGQLDEAVAALGELAVPDGAHVKDKLFAAALRSVLERAVGGGDSQAIIGGLRDSFAELFGTRSFVLGGAPLLDYSRNAALSELILRLTESDPRSGVAEAFELVARVQCLGSMARSVGGVAMLRGRTGRQLAAELKAHADVVLAYAFGWERSHVFVVDEDGLRCETIPAGGETLRQLARECVETGGEALSSLGGLLVPADVPAESRLLVVGLDELGHLPFAELLVAGERTVGELFAVSHVPSVPVALLVDRRSLPGGRRGVALLVNPNAGDLALDLPFEDLREMAPGGRPSPVRRGTAASMDALEATADSLMAVVVAHGTALDDGRRAIALSDGDGQLDAVGADRVRGLNKFAPFVALYVCRAGQDRLRLGEDGGESLAHACLAAGARAVLVAHGDVQVDAIMDFGPRFADQLERGASPAEALRAERGGDGRRLGGFRVVGLGHAPVWRGSPAPFGAIALVAAIAGCLAGLGSWLLRGRSSGGHRRGVVAGS